MKAPTATTSPRTAISIFLLVVMFVAALSTVALGALFTIWISKEVKLSQRLSPHHSIGTKPLRKKPIT